MAPRGTSRMSHASTRAALVCPAAVALLLMLLVHPPLPTISAASCPAGSKFLKITSAAKGTGPTCMCSNSNAHWVKGACSTSGPKYSAAVWKYLDSLNAARAAVAVPSMTWNKTIAQAAKTWANTLKNDKCGFYHPKGKYAYGQDLAWWSGSISSLPTQSVNLWIGEAAYYKLAAVPKGCQTGKSCGHYTQVVWKTSTQLGCGTATCSDGSIIVACNYSPPGNMLGLKPY